MNKDQKGDLVEQLIFEAYKDKDVRSAVYFKDLIKKEYGYKVSSDLYAKIINYQVNKYGVTLQNLNQVEYVNYFGLKSNKIRNRHKEVVDRRKRNKSLIKINKAIKMLEYYTRYGENITLNGEVKNERLDRK